MSETETKQIVGVCSEISEKNGWTKFSIDVGSQYPVGLSTKLPALIEQAREVGQETATWTFKESQGGENPNKPGTFYTNRYLEKAELGGEIAGMTAREAADAITTVARAGVSTAGGNAYSADDIARFEAKERRDYRSRAWAQTLGAFTHTISVADRQDPEKMIEIFKQLQPFQRKVFTDVCQSFAFPDDDTDVPFDGAG